MDICNKAIDFFMEQKSTKAIIEDFIDQFMENYENLRHKERELVAQCIHPLFRRYYYSTILPDSYMTYASIINGLIEKECGKGIILFPVLKPVYQGKKIQRIEYEVACYKIDKHWFVRDMEIFLEIAAKGITIGEFGILPLSECGKLKNKVMIDDRHYFNMITMTALDAGLIQEAQAGDGHFYTQTTKETTDFLSLGNKEKLQFVIEAIVKQFSRVISDGLPELDFFSVDKTASMLRKPTDFVDLFYPIAKKLNIDQDLLTAISEEDYIDFESDLSDEDLKQLASISYLLVSYDMYFLTPFGHYLQLIQPVYAFDFFMDYAIGDLLDAEDIQEARTGLFMGAASYDLTPLGEALLGKGRKPKRKFGITEKLSDDEIMEIITAIKDDIFYEFDDDDEYDYEGESNNEIDIDDEEQLDFLDFLEF